jgi:hypothetical protein
MSSVLELTAEGPDLLRAAAISGVALHIAGGGLGIIAGYAALAVRKGQRPHRVAGIVFCGAMMVMAGFAGVMAIIGAQRLNSLAALLTLYLVGTAWIAVRRKTPQSGRPELAALVLCVSVFVAAVLFGLQAASPAGLQDGDPTSGNAPDIYFAFAAVAALAAGLDIRTLRRGGLAGFERLRRHLWRMCAALFIATGSFFFGQADVIPEAVGGPHLTALGLGPLAALVFWMIKTRPKRRPRPALAAT